MSLFQRLADNSIRPDKFLLQWDEPKPIMELALSVTQSYTGTMQKPYLNFGAGLYKGTWYQEGIHQQEIWTFLKTMTPSLSDNHKDFIDKLLDAVWESPLIGRNLRIAIGKHYKLDQEPRRHYESYVDVEMQPLRKLGDIKGKDILLAMFYHLLGYNKHSNELLPIMFREEEEWKKSNTDHIVLQDLILRPVLLDSNDNTSTVTLETHLTMPPVGET